MFDCYIGGKLKFRAMKMFNTYCVLFFLLCSAAVGVVRDFPESLTLKDGTVYDEVKLISHTSSDVIIKHSEGVKNIHMFELSKDLQESFGYTEPDTVAMDAEQEAQEVERQVFEVRVRANFPETLRLTNGTLYENVRLISFTAAEVVFLHSGGAKNVKVSELEAAERKLLNYSEAEAVAVEAMQAERTALRLKKKQADALLREEAKALAEKKKHLFMIRGHVHQVLEDGVLIQAGEPTDLVYYGIRVSESEAAKRKYPSYTVARPPREFGLLYVEGHPRFKDFTDADVVDLDVYRDGIFRSEGTTRKQFVFLKEYY